MNCFLIKHINLKKKSNSTQVNLSNLWSRSWGHDYNIEGKPKEKSQSRVFNQPKDKR
jgi:hypothetical protein